MAVLRSLFLLFMVFILSVGGGLLNRIKGGWLGINWNLSEGNALGYLFVPRLVFSLATGTFPFILRL